VAKFEKKIIVYLRKNRGKTILASQLSKKLDLPKSELNLLLREMEKKKLISRKDSQNGKEISLVKTLWGKSSAELILEYLRKNRGREIPVAEISDLYYLKKNTISNSIKELELKGLIEIDRRPLKKGRYTVIWNKGDQITQQYKHTDEIYEDLEAISQEEDVSLRETTSLDFDREEHIEYLRSKEFDQITYRKKIVTLSKNSFEFVSRYLTPLMIEVGDKWEINQLSTGDEHIITQRVEKVLIELISERNNKQGELILILPVESEFHTLALLSLELILTDYDYQVINLGKPLPIESLIRYITYLRTIPKWIFLSITQEIYKGTLKRALLSLRNEYGEKVKIAIGGQGIKEDDRNLFPEANNVVITPEDLEQFFNAFLRKWKGN
jgi:DNA-binding MarR family transcriptional regulator